MYDTAQNIFSDFEAERFGKGNTDPERSSTEKYFTADLLIIDDLGTEFSNQFTVSCLYNIINTRMNHGKPMLVSTNLKSDELLSKYDSRIVSRLFGEFTAHHFVGSDIRLQKLKRPAQDE